MFFITTTEDWDGYQTRTRNPDIEAAKLLVPVLHHLLSMPKLSEISCSDGDLDLLTLSEMVRLASLILIAHLKKLLSFKADEIGPLLERFYALITQPVADQTQDAADVKLWALITAASLQVDGERELLVQAIRRQMSASGLASARDAIAVAREIVWIEALQSETADGLSQAIENDSPPPNWKGTDMSLMGASAN